MHIDRANARDIQHLLGQDVAERRRDAQIGLERAQRLHAVHAGLYRLHHGDAVRQRALLDGAEGNLLAAPGGLVRLAEHAHYVVTGADERLQRRHAVIGRAHKHNAKRHYSCSSSSSSSTIS